MCQKSAVDSSCRRENGLAIAAGVGKHEFSRIDFKLLDFGSSALRKVAIFSNQTVLCSAELVYIRNTLGY